MLKEEEITKQYKRVGEHGARMMRAVAQMSTINTMCAPHPTPYSF